MKSKYISTSEAAKLAGVTSQTIRNLCKDGVLTYKKHSNLYYPLKDDVIKYKEDAQQIHEQYVEIDAYKHRIIELKQQVNKECDDLRQNLLDIQMFPGRVLTMREALCAALRIVTDEYNTGIKDKELSVMWEILSGKSFTEVGIDAHISRESAHNLWNRCLNKLSRITTEHDKLVGKVKELEEELLVCRQVISNSNTNVNKQVMENVRITNALNRSVGDFELSARVSYAMKANNIHTIRDLIKCGRPNMIKLRNFGYHSIRQLDDLINNLGLNWYVDTDLYPIMTTL